MFLYFILFNTSLDSANLPGVDLLTSEKIVRPQIVEIVGDVLPGDIKEIARTRSANIPALEEVVSVLQENGIKDVVTKRFEVQKICQLSYYINHLYTYLIFYTNNCTGI
ncbi:hypothetical protein EON65_47090 [archaeon]|nr:MAG: hypothetical protein EON65_47090 [archaeon]